MTVTTYPLSFGQQAIWFVHETRGAKSVYHDRAVFELTGKLDVPAFRAAIDLLVRRHDELRRRIIVTAGVPQQVSDDKWRGELRVQPAARRPHRGAELDAFLQATLRPFDLAEGPLFRVDILSDDDEHHVVAFTMHRIIADCWSLRLMLEEISRTYSDLIAGSDVRDSEPSMKYADFVLWQGSPEQAAEFEHLLADWVDHVGDAPRTLDLRNGRSLARSETGPVAETIEFHIPAASLERLRGFAQTCSATLFMALLGVFDVALAQAARAGDVLVGVPVAGRTSSELEQSIGYFVNLLAVRGDMRDDPTSTQLIRRVRAAVLWGMTHQDLPFGLLAARLGDQAADTHPLVQATIQLIDGVAASDLNLPGLDTVAIPVDEYQIAYALTLNLYAVPDGLRARLLYTLGEVDPQLAVAIARQFSRLVDSIPEHPDAPISHLPVLSSQPHPAPRDARVGREG